MTTRSRSPMPPPAPPPAGRRQGNDHGQGGHQSAEPAWPPLPAAPHRTPLPDPRYAATEQNNADQYRYPDAQTGYDAPPPAPPRQQSATLSQLAASMRSAEAGQHYQDMPQQPRYGHQGHAAYSTPPPARSARAAPPAPPPPAPRADELRGPQYDDWQHQQDPTAYDLGSYGRPAAPQHAPRHSGQQSGHVEDPDFEPHEPSRRAERGASNRYAEQAPDPRDQDYADDEYEEEPKHSGRRWLIVAALVGSIGLGGALAYVYKSYIVDKTSGRTAVVKASQQPARTAPETPGGKQFANQDSKILGKLEQEGGRSDVDATGVRRVQTIPFGRDGAVAAPPAAPVLPPSNRPSVPGMTIVDGFPSGGGTVTPPVGRAPPPPPVAADVTPPRTNIPPPPSPPPAARAAPPPPAAVARVNPPVTPSAEPPAAPKRPQAKVADAAGTTATAARKSTSGYVAVLTTRRSRMDALRSFADMQQKYSVLQDKVPDVIEADLSSRNLGTMYRLVVGPPGPRQQVSALCSQLKAAGYTDCWATQY